MTASTLMVLITIISVSVGLVCVLAAFPLFMYGYPRWIIWVLGIVALITITVIPVVIAVFYASVANS